MEIILLMLLLFIVSRGMLVCVMCLFKLVSIQKQGFKDLEDIKTKAEILFNKGENWEHLYTEFDMQGRFAPVMPIATIKNILDLTKWTYNDFFPKNN